MSHYQEIILQHAREPRGFGSLPEPSRKGTGHNALCGDSIEIWLASTGPGKIQITFQSQGCALCRASASMMVHELSSRDLRDICEIVPQIVSSFKSFLPLASPPWSEEMAALSDMRRFPSRLSCVLLPWETLQKILLSKEYAEGSDSI